MFFTARACCLLRASCCRLAPATQVVIAAAVASTGSSNSAAATLNTPTTALGDAASVAKRRGRRRRRRRLSSSGSGTQPGKTHSDALPLTASPPLITPPAHVEENATTSALVEDAAVAQALAEVERSLNDMPHDTTSANALSQGNQPLTANVGDLANTTKEAILARAIASAQQLNARALQLEEQTRPSYSAAERIERRRSKFAVAETEFDVGITERLFPELRRLPALHELHFGDAVVREVDRATYFAKQPTQSNTTNAAEKGAAVNRETQLSDEAFAAFDAESASATVAEADIAPAAQDTSAAVNETDINSIKQSSELVLSSMDTAVVGTAMPVPSGQYRPWFVPNGDDGAVRLKPLSVADCLCLLQFVLRLRGQGVRDLSPRLQRKVIAAQRVEEESDDTTSKPAVSNHGLLVVRDAQGPLCFEDVMTYLDTAPAPVEAFTADLHPRDALRSPAFVFVLYVENVSVQNAIGHLAALFSLPQRAFLTHTAASKMSCATLLCALEANRLRKEHLLLVNTMRHPGFVLRISYIRAVPEEYGQLRDRERRDAVTVKNSQEGVESFRPAVSASAQLFTDLALWQPLYESEVLLRRVSCGSRAELERRLRAMRTVGAVFFCTNREASLARAATDILHGHYRSALINALYRRKAPLAMRQFLLRPNVVTAAKARQATTDATIRQVLKTFIASDGSWATTVHRTPYVWRRRWLNALRATVWNAMASRRLRSGGRRVLVGDVVVKPAYRADVQRRLCTTLKAEHVQLVTSEAEAAACSIEDVFIPFLRGRYPNCLFAPQATQHPIMTREAMLAILREHHATQLLDGLSETSRVLLDIRSALSPLLFRRLLITPLEMDYVVLEDKAPLRATHFDAARLLCNDRWRWSHTYTTESTQLSGASETLKGCSLIAQSEVLEQTSIGANLPSGMLAEEFFQLPSTTTTANNTQEIAGNEEEKNTLTAVPHTSTSSSTSSSTGAGEYLVLGHATRYASGQPFIPATPHTAPAERGDRVFSVYLRAIVAGGATGLTQILREYFTLHGVLDEQDAVLQHKVHRLRREMDAETARLTAPVYCTACYNRDHGRLDGCAEFLFKRSRRLSQLVRERVRDDTLATAITAQEQMITTNVDQQAQESKEAIQVQVTPSLVLPPSSFLTMRWRLRRRNAEQPWGVMVKKDLRLVGIRDVNNLVECAIMPGMNSKEESSATWLHAALQQVQSKAATADEVTGYVCGLLTQLTLPQAETTQSDSVTNTQENQKYITNDSQTCLVSSNTVRDYFFAAQDTTSASSTLAGAQYWRLIGVNEMRVGTAAEFSAAMLRLRQARELSFYFTFTLQQQQQPSAQSAKEVSNDSALVTTATAEESGPTTTTTTVLKLSPKQATALVRQATPLQQRWLRELPETLQLVLTKEAPSPVSSTSSDDGGNAPKVSWGLHVTEDELTLSNFAQLLRRYAEGESTPHSTQLLSITPAEAFEPLRAAVRAMADAHVTRSEAKKYTDYVAALDELAELLNRFYAVTRLYGTRVETIEEVLRTLHDGQTSAPSSSSGTVCHYLLPVTLRRSRLAHTSLAALPRRLPRSTQAEIQATSSEANTLAAVTTTTSAQVEQAGSSVVAVSGQKQTSNATRTVSAELRFSPTAGRLLTQVEQQQSTVKVVINRLVQNAQTARKWGVRVRAGSCILRGLQHNRLFSFEVIAAKRKQVVRITDALRFFPGPSESTASASTQPRYYTNYLYVIVSVNDRAVQSYDVLSHAMHAATAVLNAESIVLHVRQYRLAQVAVTVRRGGVGEASALSPVGLQVTPDMAIHAVRPGGPMALAIEAATTPSCSLRECIRDSTSSTSSSSTSERNEEEKGTTLQVRQHDTPLVRVPVLQRALADCLAVLHSSSYSSTSEGHDRAVSETTSSRRSRRGRRRKTWVYDYDEDRDELASSSLSTESLHEGNTTSEESSLSQSARRARRMQAALNQLRTVADTVLRELGYCEMVDGVQLLQALYVREFCHRALACYTQEDNNNNNTVESIANTSEADVSTSSTTSSAMEEAERKCEELSERLMEQLAQAAGQVRWRVMYAARAKQTLRTSADVASVLAAGVAEETIYIQQCAF